VQYRTRRVPRIPLCRYFTPTNASPNRLRCFLQRYLERKAVPSRFYGPARPNFHPITNLANRPARISVRNKLRSARDDPNRCPNRRAIYNTRVTKIDNTRNSRVFPLLASILRFVPLTFRSVRIRKKILRILRKQTDEIR